MTDSRRLINARGDTRAIWQRASRMPSLESWRGDSHSHTRLRHREALPGAGAVRWRDDPFDRPVGQFASRRARKRPASRRTFTSCFRGPTGPGTERSRSVVLAFLNTSRHVAWGPREPPVDETSRRSCLTVSTAICSHVAIRSDVPPDFAVELPP